MLAEIELEMGIEEETFYLMERFEELAEEQGGKEITYSLTLEESDDEQEQEEPDFAQLLKGFTETAFEVSTETEALEDEAKNC